MDQTLGMIAHQCESLDVSAPHGVEVLFWLDAVHSAESLEYLAQVVVHVRLVA